MRVGIALGGGGAKGIAHIAVLRVLESARVPIDLIAGTSAGAIIGSLYAAGKAPDEIERLMRRLKFRHWIARDRSHMGLFSTDGIRRIIETEIGKGARIENLRKPLTCVAVDLDAREEVVFTSGLVADAVCASAAFPGIFAPVRIGERHFIDGGTLNPVPFDVARRRGAARVIAIDLGAEEPLFTANMSRKNRRGGWLFRLLLTAEQQSIFRIVARTIGIMTKQLRAQKLAQAPPDLVLYPDLRNVGLMDYDLIDVCLAAGESAARAALPQIAEMLAPSPWTRVQREWRAWTRRMMGK